MELASPPLKSYYAVFPVPPASRNFSLSLPVFRASIPRISSPFLASKAAGFLFPCEKERSRSSFLAAGVGNTTAVTDESAQEHMPLGKKLNSGAEDGAVEMMRTARIGMGLVNSWMIIKCFAFATN
ncbi:UNVERIFIED_CONTAM: hypothetical protein Sangu_2245600 [Sesamum angustifolium]|uniref:Uncharacterized protein n=1 Tax=Sesamum angustifolium TaxID=2727405 RepID=A0AAW2L3X2_9LAMI